MIFPFQCVTLYSVHAYLCMNEVKRSKALRADTSFYFTCSLEYLLAFVSKFILKYASLRCSWCLYEDFFFLFCFRNVIASPDLARQLTTEFVHFVNIDSMFTWYQIVYKKSAIVSSQPSFTTDMFTVIRLSCKVKRSFNHILYMKILFVSWRMLNFK